MQVNSAITICINLDENVYSFCAILIVVVFIKAGFRYTYSECVLRSEGILNFTSLVIDRNVYLRFLVSK